MKKYQIFVSSTLKDLTEERRLVQDNFLSLGHIPVGMEKFGASDQQQMAFIKAEIDRSDYYVLIIGGKYGSIDSLTGKSYTQLEYEYAISKNLPVLVFLRKDRHALPPELRDTDGVKISKLDSFIEEASGDNRIRDEWSKSEELVLKSGNALTKEVNRTRDQAVGWVRSDDGQANAIYQRYEDERREKLTVQSQYHALLDQFNSLKLTLSSAQREPNNLYEQINDIGAEISSPFADAETKVLLREKAVSLLDQLILIATEDIVPPNLLFNSAQNAARMGLTNYALKFATLAQHTQPGQSNRLALLHRQLESGAAFSVQYDGSGRLVLERDRGLALDKIALILNETMEIVSDGVLQQCEIVYSEAWNISQQTRETGSAERLLATLMMSVNSRQGLVVEKSEKYMSKGLIPEVRWEDQKGKQVPSYLLWTISNIVCFLGGSEWREDFLFFLSITAALWKEESPMSTWHRRVVEEALATAERVSLDAEVRSLFGLEN